MDVTTRLSEWQRLLLMAARVHGLSPDTNLKYANTARVIRQALKWRGVMNGEVQEAWERYEYCPIMEDCYGALIAMIRTDPPEEALFQGQGNYGNATEPPAYPHFTSCRLTERGTQLAEELLKLHPEYHDR
jgi:hypothetical protein